MSHLAYYDYQATARGVGGAKDVARGAQEKAFIYERLVRRWLPARSDAKIAELACGHGSFLFWLIQEGYTNVVGIDSSPEQTGLAASTGAQVQTQDAMEWLGRQNDSTYDTLVAIDFIEHISKDDMMALLKLGQQKLRPGGRMILRYPNADSPLVGLNLFNDITHIWTYTTNCLNALAKMHGFALTEFADEGWRVARDRRWIKLPIARLSEAVLQFLFRSVSRERVFFWSSSIWACLHRNDGPEPGSKCDSTAFR
jgi:2-polyprenyl-3-methyl-5-hydroxy-6-metoxy-1,4-benzoquinol methylase